MCDALKEIFMEQMKDEIEEQVKNAMDRETFSDEEAMKYMKMYW